jgi:tetratricopeptide (TPR) repeat protein
MYPEKIEETLRFFNLSKNENIGMYFTNFIRIDKQSKIISAKFLDNYQEVNRIDKHSVGSNFYKIERETAFDILIKDCFIGTSSVMLPKKTVMEGFRFDEKIQNADDLDLWLTIIHKYNLGFIDRVLHGYRTHGEGLFGTASSKRIIHRATILQKHAPFIKNVKTKKMVNNKIAKTLYSAGYYHQNKGEYKKAIAIYTNAFIKYRKCILLSGIVFSLLKQLKSQWKI